MAIVVVASVAYPIQQDTDFTCRDEVTGEALDWFTLYKLPKLYKEPRFANGTAYTLMTNKQPQWQLSSLSINSSLSPPALTMARLYQQQAARKASGGGDFGYVLYNDQADDVTFTMGHSKGVLMFNETGLVWIVHSVPHFPPKTSDHRHEYYINSSQCYYGQSMLCMSLTFDQIKSVGRQLLFNYPQVYDAYIPDYLRTKYVDELSELVSVVDNGAHVTEEPWSNVEPLTTRGGEQMLSFAKYNEYGEDLYSGVVAQTLDSSLDTETWNNGGGTFPSNCTDKLHSVYNVEELHFAAIDLSFSVHNDHSKWAVTQAQSGGLSVSNTKAVCIGDINRQKDQTQRGGGTVCFVDNDDVWNEYSKLVSSVERCT